MIRLFTVFVGAGLLVALGIYFEEQWLMPSASAGRAEALQTSPPSSVSSTSTENELQTMTQQLRDLKGKKSVQQDGAAQATAAKLEQAKQKLADTRTALESAGIEPSERILSDRTQTSREQINALEARLGRLSEQ